MKKVILSLLAVVTALALTVTSCGKKSDSTPAATSSTSSAAQTMDQLPKITSPVVSGAAYTALPEYLSTTGVNLAASTTSTFSGLGGSGSRAMCEVTNVVKNLIADAAKADKILCYIQNTLALTANKTTISAAGVNVYDGNSHIFALNFGDGSTPKIKIKVTRSGDKISDFRMHACFQNNTQTEYVGQTITGSSIAMTSVSLGSQGSSQWKNKTTASGTLNSSLQFIGKEVQTYSANISTSNSSTWTNYSFSQLNQFPDYVNVYGYFTGASSGGGNTYANTTKVAGQAQLLGSSVTPFSLQNLAIGDGSVVGTNSGQWSSTTYSHSFSDSWSGDTKLEVAPASSGSYYAAAAALTVPTTDPTSTASGITFTGEEVWDCSGTAEANLAVDQAGLDSACSVYSMGEGDNWINCYTAFGN